MRCDKVVNMESIKIINNISPLPGRFFTDAFQPGSWAIFIRGCEDDICC